MTENNTTLEQLKIGIGNEEAEKKLQPGKVKILGGKTEEVGEKKSQKLILLCKHPDKEEPISISSVKFEKKGKLETSGLWMNLDSKGLIKKNSAVAIFMQKAGVITIDLLIGKELETAIDESGYLCFKAY